MTGIGRRLPTQQGYFMIEIFHNVILWLDVIIIARRLRVKIVDKSL